jgi:sporulation protein YlmC with PRC-barrel domain
MATSTVHPNHQLISSEDVEGTSVYDTKGTKIGDIDHLMIDKVSGRVNYAVMSFGGFIGLGHSHYPIPWNALKYGTKLNGYVTGITEEQLKDAPAFSDDSWSDRTHQHYNVRPYW